MNILELFTGKSDSKVIGQVECSSSTAGNMFIGLMQSMGMTNPVSLYSNTKTGVKISKSGNKFKLTLSSYQPPVQITWTNNIPLSELINVLEELSQTDKKVGFMNLFTTNEYGKTFQLGIGE